MNRRLGKGLAVLAMAVMWAVPAKPATAQEGSHDERQGRIADRVPAFCGLWIEEPAGELHICLSDDGRSLDAAHEAIKEVFSDEDLADLTPVAVRGEYDWATLMRWYERLGSSRVSATGGVTLTDIDEELNRIVIGVTDPIVEAEVRKSIAEARIPEGIIAIEYTGDPVSFVASRSNVPFLLTLVGVIGALVGGVLFWVRRRAVR